MIKKISLLTISAASILMTGCSTTHDWNKALLEDTKRNSVLVENYDSIARQRIMNKVSNKDFTTIELYSGPKVGSFKPLFTPEMYGYVVCYNVNTKNILGGQTGNRLHLFVFKNNSILVEASQSSLDPIQDKRIAESCEKALNV